MADLTKFPEQITVRIPKEMTECVYTSGSQDFGLLRWHFFSPKLLVASGIIGGFTGFRILLSFLRRVSTCTYFKALDRGDISPRRD